MNFIKRLWSDEKGEDVTEYALVVGLVAIAAVVGMGVLGGALDDWMNSLGNYVGTVGAGTLP